MSVTHALSAAPRRWSGIIFPERAVVASRGPFLVGTLKGEGVGPELLELSGELLRTLAEVLGCSFTIREGGVIGTEAFQAGGRALSGEVVDFCGQIFAEGGAILAGPGGGRFVYELREKFGLFLKLNPLRSFPELESSCRLKPTTAPVEILVVRENLGGLYQGTAQVIGGGMDRRVEQRFGYTQATITPLLEAAASLAAARRGRLAVVAKESGLPELSQLWFEAGRQAGRAAGVTVRTLDIDFAAYQLLSRPEEFDVVAVPNCFGDILADLGGLFSGSRGNTEGASFASTGAAVYQTNHGAAYDLAGRDLANPAGQIFALALLLRESFGLVAEALALEQALRRVWQQGWRTADLAGPGTRTIGTREFGRLVVSTLRQHQPAPPPAPSALVGS